MELHIIDLSNVLCVGAFAGRSKGYATQNIPTGGIYQVIQRIRKINPFENPDKKLVIVTDHKENIRKDKYDIYKSQRGKYDSESTKIQKKGVRLQEELILNVLSQVGIPIFTKEGYEADDLMFNIIYNYVVQEGNPLHHDTTVYLHTSDGDWIGVLGLAPNNIFYECTTTVSELSQVNTYRDFIKVTNRYPEYEYLQRALYGDKADNYKGITDDLGVGFLNQMQLELEEYQKTTHISQYFWYMDWWREYLLRFAGTNPNYIASVIENVELAFPYFLPEIALGDLSYIDNYTPDWSKLYEFVDLFSIKALQKQLGKISPFSDEKAQALNKLKVYYKSEYNEVFKMYTGLTKELSEPVLSTEAVDRIYHNVTARIPTINI